MTLVTEWDKLPYSILGGLMFETRIRRQTETLNVKMLESLKKALEA